MQRLSTTQLILISLVIVALGVPFFLKNVRTKDPASQGGYVGLVLQKEKVAEEVVKQLVSGCAAKALTDKRLADIVAMSRGQACMQVVSEEIDKTLRGEGTCSASDRRCLFTVGYVMTARRAAGVDPKTESEVAALQTEVDQAFDKINATQEQQ